MFVFSQAWWYISVIPALGRQRWEYCEFKASMGLKKIPCLKKHKNQTTKKSTSL
jgi:hypothetical protein